MCKSIMVLLLSSLALWLNCSVFAEAPIKSGLKLHLDASELTLNNNDEVTIWTDLSGNNNDAVATAKPKFLTNTINGKPTVHFSGDDWMDLPDGIVSLGAVNAFVVAKMSSPGYCLGSYSAGWFYIKYNSNGFSFTVGDDFDHSQSPDNDFHIFQLRHIGNIVEERMDGRLVATGNDSKTIPIPGFNLGSYNDGAGAFMHGDIAEVIIYDRALNASEHSTVQEYLMNKYGFQTLPVTSGMKLWLDADKITNISNNDYINTWHDLSGYNNNAESVGGFRPRYVTQVLNDRPAVQFNSANWMDLPDDTASLGAVNAFVVARMTSNGYCLGSNSVDLNSNEGRFYIKRNSGGFTFSVGAYTPSGSYPADNDFHIFQLSHIGTTVEVRMDGELIATGNDSNAIPIPSFNLGSYNAGVGAYMGGDIGKVYIYDRALSNHERELVEDFLFNQYGLSNDFTKVQFANTTSSAVESVNTASIQVTLSSPSDNTITVDYNATGGIASGNGVDYILNSGTLTFSPNETIKYISIPIINDSDWELNETIEVTLANVSGPNVALGTNNRHTYSIINDDIFIKNPFSAQVYLTAAKNYADTMILHARDRYGIFASPLFASTLNLTTMNVPTCAPPLIEGVRESDRMPTGNNAGYHQELFELLYELTNYYNDDKYANNADAALTYFFAHCKSPVTGLLAWGEHLGWDFFTEQRTFQHTTKGTHEFANEWRLWNRCNQLSPIPCRTFALGLWNHQIHDQTICTFSRHASYDEHGTHEGAEFPRHGGFYITTWVNAYANSTDETFQATMLLAANALVTAYEDRRASTITGSVPVGGIPAGTVLPYSTSWWPESELRMVVEAVKVSPLLTSSAPPQLLPLAESLEDNIEEMATNTDTVILANINNPGVWASGFGAENYMLYLERYQQNSNNDYLNLFLNKINTYLTMEPDLSKPLYPREFASTIKALIAGYEITSNTAYKERADYFGQMALKIFFTDSSCLPQVTSLNPGLYEAVTGGDDLMLQLYRLSQL